MPFIWLIPNFPSLNATMFQNNPKALNLGSTYPGRQGLSVASFFCVLFFFLNSFSGQMLLSLRSSLWLPWSPKTHSSLPSPASITLSFAIWGRWKALQGSVSILGYCRCGAGVKRATPTFVVLLTAQKPVGNVELEDSHLQDYLHFRCHLRKKLHYWIMVL